MTGTEVLVVGGEGLTRTRGQEDAAWQRQARWNDFIRMLAAMGTLLGMGFGAMLWIMDANQRVLIYKVDQSLDRIQELDKRVRTLEQR